MQMLLFLSLFGIFLSLILLYFNVRNYRSSLYLGLFFLFASLYCFYQYILLYSKSATLISLFIFNLSVAVSPLYLIGPMLYWYTRSVLTDNPKLKRSDLWHFLPMVIYFIAALPNAFVPWHEKVEVARLAAQDTSIVGVYKATLLGKIFTQEALYLSRVFLILGYTIWSGVLLVNYKIKEKSSEVLSKQHFMKKWLFSLLGFFFILIVSQLFLIVKSYKMHFSDLFFTFNIIRMISAVGLIGLLISPLFFPAVLYGLPRVPESLKNLESGKQKTHSTKREPGKTSVQFESDYLASIREKTDSYMKEHKLYLQHDCNLSYLSKQLNVPAHHLAYYFREIKKQPFNDFRNEWRINHAKSLIKEGKANEVTLEAIGMLSGFSSRNAFINDFKKVEGVSPSIYASRYN